MKRHHISFKHAINGITYCLRTQPNFRIHLVFATLAVIAGFYFNLQSWEWTTLVFIIVLVLITETINTALESMVDLITTERRQSAKIAKDTAAGMVLITAIASVVVGIVIFLPYITELLKI